MNYSQSLISGAKPANPATIPFSPLCIASGLGAWYPTDRNTVAGATSSLEDYSSNLIHLAQGTGSKQPSSNTRNINGVNVLDFVAANLQDLSDTTNAVATALSGVNKPFAFFAVAQKDDNLASKVIIDIESTVSSVRYIAFRLLSSAKLNVARGDDSASTNNLSSTASVDNNPHILSCRYDGTDLKMYIDGVLDSTQAMSLGTITLNQMRLGSYYGSNQHLDGGLGDTIILTSNPTDAVNDKIVGYLAHKYGLTANLDIAHPYKTNKPSLLI